MIIRDAEPRDVGAILALIKGLATYEKEPDAVINTAEALHRDLFVDKLCEGMVAEENDQIIGFTIFYTSYSTWKGPCIYLEDIFVLPEKRKLGAGSKMFDRLVEIAKERKVSRMDWQVLDWNQPAIDFYERKGATIDKNWYNGRMFFPENDSA